MDEADISPDGLYYCLDAADRIIEIGGNWDGFAASNQGQQAMTRQILGTYLHEHIVDDNSRMFIYTILHGVRTLNRPATRPYRCDSPTLKRFMQMTVTPLENGVLRVSHHLLRTEALSHPLNFHAANHRIPTAHWEKAIVRCSMCNQVKIDQSWLTPENALEKQPEVARMASIPVIYTVCPQCFAGIRHSPAKQE